MACQYVTAPSSFRIDFRLELTWRNDLGTATDAYFTKLTEGQLRTIDDIPMLRDMSVPEGIFMSARTNKPNKKGEVRGTSSGVKRTFAPFPSSAPPRRLPPPELQPQPVASTSTAHLSFPPGPSQSISSSSPESPVGAAPIYNAAVQVSSLYTQPEYTEANLDYHPSHFSDSNLNPYINSSSNDSSSNSMCMPPQFFCSHNLNPSIFSMGMLDTPPEP